MTGQMSRTDALERIRRPEMDPEFLEREFEYVATKLCLDVTELRKIFDGPNRTCADYRNKMKLIEFAGRVLTSLGMEKRLYK